MRFYISIFALCLLASCNEEVADPVDLASDQDYFPVELNRPVIYAQDSIVLVGLSRGVRYDTARSQVREQLVESFTTGDGQTVYRGERWQRTDGSAEWQFVQTYTLQKAETAAFRTEDNLTFTKLIFPITPNRSWDGNVAFDVTQDIPVGGEFLDVYNGWNYRYAPTMLDTTLNGNALTETQLVIQAEVNNAIEYRQAFERYAPGIGLVERFLDARHTQCRNCCNADLQACSLLPWDEKAEKGYIIHQTLLSFE
ncbi:hypothetical protein [Lewinella sp. 4G2]|uniref:hypothetical protein n=1 Tax=Lewinella sp. 4G2 TaxID=1803372 RepID=UPI0007B4AAE1|nr:hypothetical protein [Lewinella sp. 4G2]OAV45206.1 hypothetical protein A3850_012195 [Lewinella sp. 4G2]